MLYTLSRSGQVQCYLCSSAVEALLSSPDSAMLEAFVSSGTGH